MCLFYDQISIPKKRNWLNKDYKKIYVYIYLNSVPLSYLNIRV